MFGCALPSVTTNEDARRPVYTSFMRLNRYSQLGLRMIFSPVPQHLVVSQCHRYVSPDCRKNSFVPGLFVDFSLYHP